MGIQKKLTHFWHRAVDSAQSKSRISQWRVGDRVNKYYKNGSNWSWALNGTSLICNNKLLVQASSPIQKHLFVTYLHLRVGQKSSETDSVKSQTSSNYDLTLKRQKKKRKIDNKYIVYASKTLQCVFQCSVKFTTQSLENK